MNEAARQRTRFPADLLHRAISKLNLLDAAMTREEKAIIAATPGRLLKEEFLDAHQLSQSELSRRTGIPRSTINEIIKGKRPINAEIAFTLGTFFNMDPQFWINLQSRYDLRLVQFQRAKSIRARVQPWVA